MACTLAGRAWRSFQKREVQIDFTCPAAKFVARPWPHQTGGPAFQRRSQHPIARPKAADPFHGAIRSLRKIPYLEIGTALLGGGVGFGGRGFNVDAAQQREADDEEYGEGQRRQPVAPGHLQREAGD